MIYIVLFLNLAFSAVSYQCPKQSGDFAASINKFEEQLLKDKSTDEEMKLLFTEYSFSSSQPFAKVYRDCAIFLSEAKDEKLKTQIDNNLKSWRGCLAGLNQEKNETVEKIISCWNKIKK